MGRNEVIIAFCGHANYIENAGDEQRVLSLLEKRVGKGECELFLGEYGGFDSFAYRCAQKYRAVHPESRLVFVTPYLMEEYRKNSVEYTKERFDLVLYPPLEKVPPRYAIARRNRWIVEQADIVIAYITNGYGGAYTMYRYALKKGKEIYNIAPMDSKL